MLPLQHGQRTRATEKVNAIMPIATDAQPMYSHIGCGRRHRVAPYPFLTHFSSGAQSSWWSRTFCEW